MLLFVNRSFWLILYSKESAISHPGHSYADTGPGCLFAAPLIKTNQMYLISGISMCWDFFFRLTNTLIVVYNFFCLFVPLCLLLLWFKEWMLSNVELSDMFLYPVKYMYCIWCWVESAPREHLSGLLGWGFMGMFIFLLFMGFVFVFFGCWLVFAVCFLRLFMKLDYL